MWHTIWLGLPIATYISTKYNKPLIFVRDKLKLYGTQKLIEGEYKFTDRCVIIDDVITSGNSLQKTIDVMQDKVNIVDIGVIINSQENPQCSLPVKSVLYKTDVVKYRLKKISNLKKSNLCFAADIKNPTKLLDILDIIGKYIVVCKIHYDIINIDSYEGNFKEELNKFMQLNTIS